MQVPEVFVIAPNSPESAPVYETVRNAVLAAGLTFLRVDSAPPGAKFTTWVLDRIRQADLIVADISRQNPNVLYELGFAHAFGKPTILLFNVRSGSDFPADLTGFQYIGYDLSNLRRLEEQVRSEVEAFAFSRSA